ncbi:hypothetical protein IJ472_06735 [bacterium]|nr:hypothetical protein [bacterium]
MKNVVFLRDYTFPEEYEFVSVCGNYRVDTGISGMPGELPTYGVDSLRITKRNPLDKKYYFYSICDSLENAVEIVNGKKPVREFRMNKFSKVADLSDGDCIVEYSNGRIAYGSRSILKLVDGREVPVVWACCPSDWVEVAYYQYPNAEEIAAIKARYGLK